MKKQNLGNYVIETKSGNKFYIEQPPKRKSYYFAIHDKTTNTTTLLARITHKNGIKLWNKFFTPIKSEN